jgi:hypothetical protein
MPVPRYDGRLGFGIEMHRHRAMHLDGRVRAVSSLQKFAYLFPISRACVSSAK